MSRQVDTLSLLRGDFRAEVELPPFPPTFAGWDAWRGDVMSRLETALNVLFGEQTHALLMSECDPVSGKPWSQVIRENHIGSIVDTKPGS